MQKHPFGVAQSPTFAKTQFHPSNSLLSSFPPLPLDRSKRVSSGFLSSFLFHFLSLLPYLASAASLLPILPSAPAFCLCSTTLEIFSLGTTLSSAHDCYLQRNADSSSEVVARGSFQQAVFLFARCRLQINLSPFPGSRRPQTIGPVPGRPQVFYPP